MPASLHGLHHVTAIASDARRNVEFYTQVLGLRLIKKTVNFDDPGAYHLYYGDYTGTPGSVLTFFHWAGLRRGRPGHGQVYAISFSAPTGSLPFWRERLAKLGVVSREPESRLEEQVLPFTDPDGLILEIVATNETDPRSAAPHAEIATEHALRGFHGVTLGLAGAERTTGLLTGTMGYRLVAQSGNRTRYTVGAGGPGTYVDLLAEPSLPRGLSGAGAVHHVAFRTPDDASQQAARALLLERGYQVSPVLDRNYFHSIYYREPEGILFEIATDPPGFAIDEPVDQLGKSLKLPAWYEPRRAEIEAALPRL